MVVQTVLDTADTPVAKGGIRRRLTRSPKVTIGATILVFFILVAIFGPTLAPHGSNWQASRLDDVPHPPSGQFWLGTDQRQHDLFSLLLAGARATLLISLVAGGLATLLSILVGVTAGYVGGKVDEVLSILTNIFLALPGLLILMVVMKLLPLSENGNPLLIGTVIALSAWAWGARVLRAQTLSLRNQDYVESARVIGERRPRIIAFEILPNLLPILASSFIFTVIYGIGAYVSLSWLGVINPTDNASWGTILNAAQASSATTNGFWWWYGPPAVCVALVGIALALLNFGIDEIVNPRMRSSRRRKGGPTFQLGLTPVMRSGSSAATVPSASSADRAETGSVATTTIPEGASQ